MRKIEDLVPPQELCKRIPDGAFADSALVLIFWCKGPNPPEIRQRSEVENDPHFDYLVESKRIIIHPAPTLAEILNVTYHTWYTDDPADNDYVMLMEDIANSSAVFSENKKITELALAWYLELKSEDDETCLTTKN